MRVMVSLTAGAALAPATDRTTIDSRTRIDEKRDLVIVVQM